MQDDELCADQHRTEIPLFVLTEGLKSNMLYEVDICLIVPAELRRALGVQFLKV